MRVKPPAIASLSRLTQLVTCAAKILPRQRGEQRPRASCSIRALPTSRPRFVPEGREAEAADSHCDGCCEAAKQGWRVVA